MHKLNVRILGPSSFISTLNELKNFLKFNCLSNDLNNSSNIILFHSDALLDENLKAFIQNNKSIKICVGNRKKLVDEYDASLDLPTTVKEINRIVESIAAKKKFNLNSSIVVKNYLLNKNEKKLFRLDNYIVLTEKEVQLLDLFLVKKKPISKNDILASVWNYAPDADTHTVETHIYRLRKKIIDKFKDEKFILNNKDGYYL